MKSQQWSEGALSVALCPLAQGGTPPGHHENTALMDWLTVWALWSDPRFNTSCSPTRGLTLSKASISVSFQ